MHIAEPATADAVLHGMMSVGRLLKGGLSGGEQLDPGSFWMLKAIATHGPLRVSELANHVALDPSTVSRHVAQLARSGLVDRTADPADRRAQLIGTSGAGRERLRAAHQRRRELLTRSLADWDPGEVADFERLLTKFVHSVESTTRHLEDTTAP